MIRKIILILGLIIIISTGVEAKQWFVQDSVAHLKAMYTGGASGAGTYVAFADGDSCLVVTSGLLFSIFVWDSDYGVAGDDIWTIQPTYSAPATPYSGNGRWRLCSFTGNINNLGLSTGETGYWAGMEQNGTDYRGWIVPDSITNSWLIRFTNTDPAANSLMLIAAPSDNECAQTWVLWTSRNTFETSSATSSPYSATSVDCNGNAIYITYSGTTHIDLPTAVAGMKVKIVLGTAYACTIDPYGTEVIRYGLTLSTSGQTLVSAANAGEWIQLECFTTGVWQETGHGTNAWTITTP